MAITEECISKKLSIANNTFGDNNNNNDNNTIYLKSNIQKKFKRL